MFCQQCGTDLGTTSPCPACGRAQPWATAAAPESPAYAVPAPTGHPKRSRLALGVGAVGVASLLLVGALVARGVNGQGTGASSPDDLVHRLESAINHKDPAAALALLAPDELPTLGDVYQTAVAKLKTSQNIDVNGAKPALDLHVDNVAFDHADLGTRGEYAKVTFHQVTIQYATHPDRLPAGIKARAQQDGGTLPAPESGTKSIDDLHVRTENGSRIDPFFVVVKEGGRWYVSITMTAGEYAVETQQLPAGNFDVSAPAGSPAATPEQAVTQLTEGAGSVLYGQGGNVDRLASLLPEGQTRALRVYHQSFQQWLDRSSAGSSADGSSSDPLACSGCGFKVQNVTASSHPMDADHARVSIDSADISNSYRSCDYSNFDPSTTSPSDPGNLSFSDVCPKPFTVHSTIHWDGHCLSHTSDDPYESGSDSKSCLNDTPDPQRLQPADFGVTDAHLVVKRERGGWVVDPVATILDYGRTALNHLDDPKVERLMGHRI